MSHASALLPAHVPAGPSAMISLMQDSDTLMREVRDVVASLVQRCIDALDAGIEIERVHGHYMRRVDELLGEAEAQAILARESNPAALRAIEDCLAELIGLRAELAAEIRQAADDEGDD